MNAAKRYKNINLPFTCPITDRKFKTTTGLSIYITKTLKMDHSEYYDEYIHHRDPSCFFCGEKGKFISVGKGYRNLCEDKECVKISFNSHSIEGIMYRNMCNREEAEKTFQEENQRQLNERMRTFQELRKHNPDFDKERNPLCVEFYTKNGIDEKKAKSIIKELRKVNAIKYSETIKSDPKKYASKFPTKVEYWVKKGYTQKEAKKKISKIQNRFSLNSCIEKYGKKKGEKVWKERQEKWQNSLIKNGNIKNGYSKISQVLFNELLEYYDIKDRKYVFYHTKNQELVLKHKNGIFLYDFTDELQKKIIEYNRDQYHANPSIYEKNDMPHPYHKTKDYTAESIWNKDREKISLAKNNGYDVIIIWDSEYKKNPKQIIEKCIEFLRKKEHKQLNVK